MIDPRELQREANVILDVLGQDLQEGKPKDAMRLLQAIVGNPLVADLAVRLLGFWDKHESGHQSHEEPR
jgi:hypothetical protein